MPHNHRFALLVVCFLRLGLSVAEAENWPGWRGPRGDGSSLDASVPVKWSATENVAWKAEMPYTGHSSPIIWKDRIILVGADTKKNRRMLVTLDRRTGKVIWEREVLVSPLERKHKLNSWASGTPVTDGKRIFVSFLDQKNMFVAAFDMDGKELWTVRPGVFSSKHGYCSSPILFKEKVIVNGDHDGNAYLIALSQDKGKTLWKTKRENKTRSYCTPIIREIKGRTQMILSGSKCIASYDPNTGDRHWIMDGPTEQFVASVVYNKGLIFITGGFPDKHILTIDPTGSGNITKTKFVKWRHYRRGVSYVPSPIAVGPYFMVVSDNGIGSCFDAATGKKFWQERMGRRYSASLVTTGKHVYFLNDDGICTVVKPGEKYEVTSVNRLGEETYASPAISQGQLFIRGAKHLFCIGKSTKALSSK
jgi:outer membrane protein assembly factor BamB